MHRTQQPPVARLRAPVLRATVAALALGCARPGLHPAAPAPVLPPAPAGRWEATLLLIGDAGAPGERAAGRPDPVLRAAARELRDAPGARAVVFLGDNVYPDGYPPVTPGAEPAGEAERHARRILDAQAWLAGPRDGDGAVPRTVPRWFVPGNHDWNDHGPAEPRDGGRRVWAQDAYLRALAARGDSVALLPSGGCPGPAARDVGRRLRVIAIDTEWWIRDPKLADAGACGGVTDRERAVARVREAVAAAGDRHVVVVAHHPLATTGPHGNNCAGFARCVTRVPRAVWGYFFGRQDLANVENAAMRRAVERALSDHGAGRRPLVYAAGHEHALQVFRGGAADWYLVSGSGNYAHTSAVACRRTSTFSLAEGGFMRLDAAADGRVRLTVLTADADGTPRARYRRWLDGAGAEGAGEGATC